MPFINPNSQNPILPPLHRIDRTLENLEISWDEKDDLDNLEITWDFFYFPTFLTFSENYGVLKCNFQVSRKKKIFQVIDLGIITALLRAKITCDLPNL